MSKTPLSKLAEIVIEDADRASRREEDRALAEARKIEREAEDRLEEMLAAARSLGEARGKVADQAIGQEATREIEAIHRGAMNRLYERFQRRVELALDALPSSGRYPEALRAFAARAAAAADAPVEVFCAKRDREAVYEACLEAGLADFQVKVLRKHTVGFVVRDLDGRTVLDARPDALVRDGGDVLRALLEAGVPAFAP